MFEITEADGKTKHKNLQVWKAPTSNKYDVNMGWQRATLAFAERPQDAPIVHFNGPLRLQLIEPVPALAPGNKVGLLTRLYTPGLGTGSDVYWPLPENVQPLADIEFSAKGPDVKSITAQVGLKERLRPYAFGLLHVPQEASGRTARITLSLPDWKEGKVAPATFEFPIGQAKPKAESKDGKAESKEE